MVRKFYWILSVVGMVLLLTAPSAQAVSVGKIEVASHLGEPFFAEIPLILENDEVVSNVTIDIATGEDYRTLEVYRDPVLQRIKTWLKTDQRGSRIEVNSNSPIETPFFNLVLKVHYGHATHFKKYVVFLELPNATASSGRSAVNTTPTRSEPSPARTSTAKADALPTPLSRSSAKPNTTKRSKTQQAPAMMAKSSSGDQAWARTSQYGPMVRGDTITTVAQRLRIDDTFSNAQVMVALFEKNRSKFGEDNINLIKAGTFLDVPSADEVRRHSRAESSRILMSQNAQWKKLVRQPKYADIAKAQKNRYSKRVRVGASASGKGSKVASKSGTARKPVSVATKPSEKSAAKTPATASTEEAASDAESKKYEQLLGENQQLKAKLSAVEAKLSESQKQAAELAALQARNKKLELRLARLQAQLEKAAASDSATVAASAPEAKLSAKPAVDAADKPAEVKEKEVAKVPAEAAPVATAPVAPAQVKSEAKPQAQDNATKTAEKQAEKVAKPAAPAVVEAEKQDEGMMLFGFPLLWVIAALVIVLLLIAAIIFLVMRKRAAAGVAGGAAVAAAAGTAAAAGIDDAQAEEGSVGVDSSEFDASEMEAAELLAAADAAKDRDSAPKVEADESTDDFDDDFAQTIGGTRSKVDLPVEQIPALTDEDTSEFDAFVEKDEAPSPDVDYLTEADVYLRYGMEDEAEEQVQMALKLNGADEAAHMKLLEVRQAKGEQKGIEEAVAQARGSLSGTELENYDNKVDELGINAESVKAAVGGEKTVEIDEEKAEEHMDALGEIERTAEVDMSAIKKEQESSDLDFDIGDIDLGSVGTDAAMASAAATADSPDDLNFDLDGMDLSSVSSEDPVSGSDSNAGDDLDFDFGDMDMDFSDDSQDAGNASEEKAENSAAVEQAESDAMDFDFGDLDMGAEDEGSASPSESQAKDDLSDMAANDLDFDLGEIEKSLAMDAVDTDGAAPNTGKTSDELSSDDSENLDFDFDLGMDDNDASVVDTSEEKADIESSSLDFNDDALDVGDDLSMLEMNFDDVPDPMSEDETPSSDETIIADFSDGSSVADDDGSDFESLDFISTITMETDKSTTAVDLGGPDVEKSLDSMSLMVDDITPALDSMGSQDDANEEELTKTLSTMSMLVDDMDTSEISVDEFAEDDDSPLDLSLSTGDLDSSVKMKSPLEDHDPDLSSLLGELEEITGLNEVPKKS